MSTVGVLGARGRMGQTVVQAVTDDQVVQDGVREIVASVFA